MRLGAKGPVLRAFIHDRSRVSAIRGPLGSGKTIGTIQKLMLLMCQQEPNADGVRPSRFVAVRNTYGDLTSTTMKDFQELFTDDFGVMRQGGLEPPNFKVNIALDDGTAVRSEVIFLALDRADAVRRLRGYQVTGFWLNEMKELVKPVVDMADLRHGRFPQPKMNGVGPTWHGMVGDTNSPDEDHWWYKLAEEDRPDDWKFFHQPGGVFRSGEKDENGREIWIPNENAENLENLPDGYYTRGIQGKDDLWIAVNIANEYGFVVDGKPVHPQYIDSVHCTKEPIPYNSEWPLIIGVDFGRTPAAAIYQRNPQWGRWLLIDEFITTDMSQAVFGPELKRYLGSNYPGAEIRAWGDPSGDSGEQATENTPLRVLNASGVPCSPAPSNSPTLRRAAVANPMLRICGDGLPAWLISPKCKITRKGFAGGFCFRRLKVVGDERYTEEPDKNMYSHPVEAAEYAPLSEGEGNQALARAETNPGAEIQAYADY